MKVSYRLRIKNNQTLRAIQIDVAYLGKRLQMSTGLSVDLKSDWNTKKGQLVNPYRYENVNEYTSQQERDRLRRIYELHKKLEEIKKLVKDELTNNSSFRKDEIKKIVNENVKAKEELKQEKKPQAKPKTLAESIIHWAKVKEGKVSHNHWRRHRSVLKKVQSYGDIDLGKLNDKWLEDFVQSLVDDGMLNTSIGKYHSCINSAIKLQGIVLNYKLTYKPLTTVIFLDEDELKDFENQEVPQRLEIVKDGFLFECYTGIRFSDIAKFKAQSMVKVNGRMTYRFVQTKTKKVHSVPLNAKALGIIDKYKEFETIPVLSNQAMNEGLKEIGALIDSLRKEVVIHKQSGNKELLEVMPKYKQLTTHVGRHTAACIWLMRGMSYDMVAEMLGVDIKTVKVYVEITDKAKLEALDRFMY